MTESHPAAPAPPEPGPRSQRAGSPAPSLAGRPAHPVDSGAPARPRPAVLPPKVPWVPVAVPPGPARGRRSRSRSRSLPRASSARGRSAVCAPAGSRGRGGDCRPGSANEPRGSAAAERRGPLVATALARPCRPPRRPLPAPGPPSPLPASRGPGGPGASTPAPRAARGQAAPTPQLTPSVRRPTRGAASHPARPRPNP